MKSILENSSYDTMLEPSDWRFSAAIVGLMQYLDYHSLDYKIDQDSIYYNSEDITEEKYIQFVEYKYGEELHHKVIENILSKVEISDDEVKLVNEKLGKNAILKKIFSKIKFNGSNKNLILEMIQINRELLIKETYGKKDGGYKTYIKVNMKAPIVLLEDTKDYCRLIGYACADDNRKSMALGFNFIKNTYTSQDIVEFDFIPFAFQGDFESFFINDNYTIQRLITSYTTLRDKVKTEATNNKIKGIREILFNTLIEVSDFIKRDVEVLVKDREKDYFETLYIRKEAIDIFKMIESKGIDYKAFATSHKVTDKYRINIQKEVSNSILNNVLLDNLIDTLLKDGNKRYLITQLINVNVLIRRDNTMQDRLKGAYACAKKVAEALETNKLESYRQKLTSSIVFKDYDRVCQILLQLSNYSGIEFNFVYDLYDNFEDNKDLAYTFANALTKKSNIEKK